jgi:hypothetical protein
MVTLKTADGKTMAIKMSALSDPDKQWITESTYTPKQIELEYADPGQGYFFAFKRRDINIRDTVHIFNKEPCSKNTMIYNCTIKELGNTLTNKWNKHVTTQQGRFVCLNWTAKNEWKLESDVNFPKLIDEKGNLYDSKDKEPYGNVELTGSHCSGKERDELHPKIQPGFFLDICNIYEIPKNSIIKDVCFFELGCNPSSYNANVKSETASTKGRFK